MEIMDIERRRELNRERVRRHRAAHAQSKETAFLPRFNRGTRRPPSETNTRRWGNKRNDSSNEESNSDGSRSESADQPEPIHAADNIEIKHEEEEEQAGAGFDFEEFVSKLKASPTSSVASNTSWNAQAIQRQSTASTSTAGQIAQNGPIPIDSNVVQMLFEAIERLSSEQSQLIAAVNRMNDTLACLTSEIPQRKREPFEKKYNLQIPFTNREDFMKFDAKLANEEDCRAALTHSLTQKYDGKKTITKNITAIMRKYLTRDVALLYTAQKAVGGKGLFKDTAFSACLLDTIDNLAEDKIIAPVPDNEYLGNLGAVLSNAKDWGVPRHERPIKRKRTNP